MTSIDITSSARSGNDRSVWTSLKRGFVGRCPKCGKGRMFRAYLKVNDACPACGEELHHHRADDAPPYVTMLIVGHVVIGAMLGFEFLSDSGLPDWVPMVVWPLIALVMSVVLLPLIKGALVAYQWALRMHGFGAAVGHDSATDVTMPRQLSA